MAKLLRNDSPYPPVPEPDLRAATALAMSLMAIPGRSGDEAGVSEFITDALRSAGVSRRALESDNAHLHTPLGGQTGNLILKLPGTLGGARRMLTSHMDTVPICVGSRPVRRGRLVRSADPTTGLGADDRAGVAVTLNAALEIIKRRLPHPPLTFCWFIQEEVGLFGARHVRKSSLGNPRLAFNWDGGAANKLTVGATGGYRIQIWIQGRASHAGAAPERGVSAIAIASLAIASLVRDGWHGAIQKDGRRGTSNVGIIQGGDATNVVTEKVYLKAEARSHDPDFRQEIVQRIEAAFRKAAEEVRNSEGTTGSVTFNGRLDYESFRLADDQPCVLAAESAIHALGRIPVRAISNGGLDANWLSARGIPTVSLGCGQLEQHTTREALDLDEFHQACRIALRLATASENIGDPPTDAVAEVGQARGKS